MVVNVVVLGAGVVGLSTALNVQQVVPGARVTVMADKFYEQTTSYGSGGMFIPSLRAFPNTDVGLLRKWFGASWKFYQELALGPEAGAAGAIVMSGYHLQNADFFPGDPLYKEFVFSCEDMTATEMKNMGFQNFRHAQKVTTIIIYMRKYMMWLRKKFEKNGGVLRQKHIRNLHELFGDYDLLVNCSGLGSRQLFGDTKVHPIRGHIVRVRAPWVKQWFHTDDDRYIIPGENLVGLGGLFQTGKDSETVDPLESQAIREKCERLFPAIKGAKVDHDWIGIRPGRERGVRLETEVLKVDGKSLPVVHNYGHGSHGVGCSWGTAVYAAKLAADLVKSTTVSKL